MIATLFQYCNAVLAENRCCESFRVKLCNITFIHFFTINHRAFASSFLKIFFSLSSVKKDLAFTCQNRRNGSGRSNYQSKTNFDCLEVQALLRVRE